MDYLEQLIQTLDRTPTPEILKCVAAQFEFFKNHGSKERVKTMLIPCIAKLNGEKRYRHLKEDDGALRLYNLLGKVSTKVGSKKLHEEMNAQGLFRTSLQFHLQWAEEYAKCGDVANFTNVLSMARERLSHSKAIFEIESGFRDLADNYLKSVSDRIFQEADLTMNVFGAAANTPDRKKGRRRSSVAHLQRSAPQVLEQIFGPNTTTKIRNELINRECYGGVSVEEFRSAQMIDDGGDDNMDISIVPEEAKRRDSSTIKPTFKVDAESENARRAVEERLASKPEDSSRRRKLSDVREVSTLSSRASSRNRCYEDEESENEKRARIYSPVVPTKHAPKMPLSTKKTRCDQTITISSDTRSAPLTSNELSSFFEEDENMKQMMGGRKQVAKEAKSERGSTSTISTRSMFDGGVSLASENNCQDAHAMFSETVHLAQEKTMGGGNEDDDDVIVISPTEKTSASTAADYSVFCDPDPTILSIQEKSTRRPDSHGGLNMVYDEKKAEFEDNPYELEDKQEAASKEHRLLDASKFSTPPSEMSNFLADESMSEFLKPSKHIVTSTPAAGVPFVNIDDYFGSKASNDSRSKQVQQKDDDDDFLIPEPATASTAFGRRISMAPEKDMFAKPSLPSSRVPIKAKENKADESLSVQLERRLSIGGNDVPSVQPARTEVEETGKKERRRSEVMTGSLNPWDEGLRRQLMNLVRPPTHMHEFKATCPKMAAMRDVEMGGEKMRILTLIGQGGYAKVYKAQSEENDVVAVKYEVPSCAWEVYVCDQVRHRLLKKGSEESKEIANRAIMQVSDAYIYMNASLLVNDYHEFGTLLDYTNHVRDPNWHLTCFLSLQMAKVIREIHSAGIVHADVKPDNFMITRKIDMKWSQEELISCDMLVVKLIDWGRAIDMATMKERKFTGRAGTECFDSPEMIDGRPWTFQPDYFGFVGTVSVLASGKYAKLTGSKLGEYDLETNIKRRNIMRELITGVITKFLNIPSCNDLPGWDDTIQQMEAFWGSNFNASEWRQAAIKFNEAADVAAKL